MLSFGCFSVEQCLGTGVTAREREQLDSAYVPGIEQIASPESVPRGGTQITDSVEETGNMTTP